MRKCVVALAFALLLVAPASALAKKTADLTFKSSGTAAAPGAVAGIGEPGTFEDFPFKIAPDELDGSATIQITFLNPADDWDMYVYRKNSTGGLETVGSATSAPGQSSETVNLASQATPIDPGDYVIRVQNYSATNPDFDGTVKFTEYVIPNKKPTAALKAPTSVKRGKVVRLDASGSKDSDGSIVNYSWDLDGNGSVELDTGTNPMVDHKFSVGVHHVAVRVVDDDGARAFKTRTIRVVKPAKKKPRKKR
jgi:hypothetical protein